MSATDVLVLLTAMYPFGRKAETFLDYELPVLARRFSRVVVLPSERDAFRRELPEGVVCDTALCDIARSGHVTEILRHCGFAAHECVRTISREGNPRAYLRHPRTYLYLLGQNLLKLRALRAFIDRWSLRGALFYDYWLENSTLALTWLRSEGFVKRAVARAHGFDLYDDRWAEGASPFQALKVARLDRIFPISAHGLRYLSRQHPRFRGKFILSRLGVTAPRGGPRWSPVRSKEASVVVSCASMLPLKRVEQIPRVLAQIGREVSWVHFGDGPLRREVERAASGLPTRVSWRLAGHVDHEDVLQFYASNRVALFISLSASEGLPVSMMEAISCGIPLLATRVGGVEEIVTDSTGRLVDVGDSPELVARSARELLDGSAPSPEAIRRFFQTNFDAEKNFGEFVDYLHAC